MSKNTKQIRVPKDLHKILKTYAAENDRTLTDLLTEIATGTLALKERERHIAKIKRNMRK